MGATVVTRNEISRLAEREKKLDTLVVNNVRIDMTAVR
jgi:hypothetical protein